jgi:hypothetical protein
MRHNLALARVLGAVPGVEETPRERDEGVIKVGL